MYLQAVTFIQKNSTPESGEHHNFKETFKSTLVEVASAHQLDVVIATRSTCYLHPHTSYLIPGYK